MKVLVVGSGGREHALCWALQRDRPDAELFCTPGNPGTAESARNLPWDPTDLTALTAITDRHDVDLTVVGPEAPLAAGLADALRGRGRRVFGPLASAARIEASKAFSKDVMHAAGVPTAESATFTDLALALAHVDRHAEPLVVKASGLAAGKGAIVCATRAEAASAVRAMLGDRVFGDAGSVVVIEDFLEGEELSVLAVTNGRDVRLLPAAQDHKRLLEGDQGPNTGGMGAYSPVSIATPALLARVEHEVLLPTLAELERRGAPFRGVLYAGLMISPQGIPNVIEFNCRLGDPETQAVLPLVDSGLTELFWQAADGAALPKIHVSTSASVTTVLAAEGYPDSARKGAAIALGGQTGGRAGGQDLVFHAATTRDSEGVLRANGGRVLAVTAVRENFADAQRASRELAQSITFEGKQYRRDIGWREAERVTADS
ncbi:MAG TPA: phosphoribosylamine--glycine ligase [Gemmatimonadales bacterium]|nr:phosphoribosylamine--glycine ligase [Gemmatimonadales bacterium]